MKRIGIIGCGNMGEAILKGIISSRLASPRYISVSDIDSAKLNRIKRAYGVAVTFNSSIVARSSSVIILAVKPQDMPAVLSSISACLDRKRLLISIAAGVTIKRIAACVGRDIGIVRAMPNMPLLISKGFTALSFSKKVDKNSARFARAIFSSVGDTMEIKERYMDAITAVSGSGPAYFFYLVEALMKSAVKFGLSRRAAREAAIKTALGSVELLDKFGGDPFALRKKVTSRGGTTEAAFKVFKKRRLGKILQSGIKAAKDRSKELSGG